MTESSDSNNENWIDDLPDLPALPRGPERQAIMVPNLDPGKYDKSEPEEDNGTSKED